MLKSFFGDRAFYRRLLTLALPIMVQNGITNFVNMLDNVMVGRVGTLEATGVTVANQLIFVFSLCVFGAVSGAGIFGAQFFGKGDHKGLRDTFRFKLICALLIAAAAVSLFYFAGRPLIGLYLRGEGGADAAGKTLAFGYRYLLLMLPGLLPFAAVQCYSGTLRESNCAAIPMVAGIAAVITNLCLNYVLIFGHFGAPRLGVNGAALATVISRFAELLIIALWTHLKPREHPFIVGAFRSLRVPLPLVRQILRKGLPLMFNEAFWSLGVAFLNQCYSVRGQSVVFAVGISQTFFNVFSVAFMSVGVSVGIILGQMLGMGDRAGARAASRKMTTFSFLVGVGVALLFTLFSGLIPRFYNTTDAIRAMAASFMRVAALLMPIDAVANATYFTLRSGGKAFLTILFDSCFMWAVTVPIAFVTSRFTALPILAIFALCQATTLLKAVIGVALVEKGIWIRTIVGETAA